MKCFKMIANIGLLSAICAIVAFARVGYTQQKIDPRLAAIRAYQADQEEDEYIPLAAQEQSEEEEITDEVFTEQAPERDIETLDAEIDSAEGSAANAESIDAEKISAEEEKDEEKDDEDDQRMIVMFLDEVNSTITPNPISSFCFATVRLQNQLKRTLNSFQARLTFGSIPITFNAKNVAPGAISSQEITLAGPACTQITGTPEIAITRCAVENMSDRQCQNRFLFRAYTE